MLWGIQFNKYNNIKVMKNCKHLQYIILNIMFQALMGRFQFELFIFITYF